MNAMPNIMSRSGLNQERVTIIVIVLAAVALGWVLLSNTSGNLQRSNIGLEGLRLWLQSEGIRTKAYRGNYPLDHRATGLAIVPLYQQNADFFESGLVDRGPDDPSDDDPFVLEQQAWWDAVVAQSVTTTIMLVLPKWENTVRTTGQAHPENLVQLRGVRPLLRNFLQQQDILIMRSSGPFSEFEYTDRHGEVLVAQIYLAQSFRAPDCDPVIGTSSAMVLGWCTHSVTGDLHLIASDPDLLNNHGLKLGDNARIMEDVIRSAAWDWEVIINYSQQAWPIAADPEGFLDSEPEQSNWSKLQYLVAPPYSVLWLGILAATLLFVWRGGVRNGPVVRSDTSSNAVKAEAIQATARLMRRTDQDGALVAEYAAARMSTVSASFVGHADQNASSDLGSNSVFLRHIERRNPASASRLRQVLVDIQTLSERIPAAEAMRHIDDLEKALEAISHDA